MARKKQIQEEKVEEKIEDKKEFAEEQNAADKSVEEEIKEDKKGVVEETAEKKDPVNEKEKEGKEEKKDETKKIKKDKAIARGVSLRISTKHSKYILKMIKGKKIDAAIKMLEEVLEFRRAVPMNGLEIPHRKNIMSGRYPLNASKEIIKILKQLKANAQNSGIENPYISLAIANIASRPYRRDRTKGKRTNLYLEAKNLEEKR